MNLIHKIVATLAFSVAIASCQGTDYIVQGDHGSELHFIPFSNVNNCAISKAREKTFNICVKGNVDAATVTKHKGYLKRSILTWLRAVKQIDDKVTGNIAFTCNADTHLNISLRPGSGTSFAGCGSNGAKATIYANRPYGTVLHELGHAFAGLSDTYTGRQAGACKPGQPASAMCWGAYGPNKDAAGFTLLWKDDVAGIQSNYKKIFRDIKKPTFTVDPLAAIDPLKPWPVSGSTINQVSAEQIFANISEKVNSDGNTFKVLISTSKLVNAAYICKGHDAVTCTSDANKVLQTKKVSDLGDRQILELTVPFNPQLFPNITLFSGLLNNGSFTQKAATKITFKSLGAGI